MNASSQHQHMVETQRISGIDWSRILVSSSNDSCPFGCTYCFARFSQYRGGTHLDELIASLPNPPHADFLYPDCDGDLFASRDWRTVMDQIPLLPYSVSLSTKARIGAEQLDRSTKLQTQLRTFGRFLKIGVSVSTKHSASEIEPHTPAYDSRMESLRRLHAAGIPNALVLRPLLAEVSDEEYGEILKEARQHTERVLVGDEWLDSLVPRALQRPEAHQLEAKSTSVGWVPGQPRWTKRQVAGRIDRLRKFAGSLGYLYFESDMALMADLSNGFSKE